MFQCDPQFYRELEKLGELRVIDSMITADHLLTDSFRRDFMQMDADEEVSGLFFPKVIFAPSPPSPTYFFPCNPPRTLSLTYHL